MDDDGILIAVSIWTLVPFGKGCPTLQMALEARKPCPTRPDNHLEDIQKKPCLTALLKNSKWSSPGVVQPAINGSLQVLQWVSTWKPTEVPRVSSKLLMMASFKEFPLQAWSGDLFRPAHPANKYNTLVMFGKILTSTQILFNHSLAITPLRTTSDPVCILRVLDTMHHAIHRACPVPRWPSLGVTHTWSQPSARFAGLKAGLHPASDARGHILLPEIAAIAHRCLDFCCFPHKKSSSIKKIKEAFMGYPVVPIRDKHQTKHVQKHVTTYR